MSGAPTAGGPGSPGDGGPEQDPCWQARRRTSVIPASRKRLVVLYVVLGALLGGLGYRAWSLQVGSHSSYVALANAARIRNIVQPPVRGQIVDDNGAPLVSNASALVVSVNMSVLSQQRNDGQAELRILARLR